MTVFVIWDPLYERVIAVHKTADSAAAKVAQLNSEIDYRGLSRANDCCYMFEYDEFELDE